MKKMLTHGLMITAIVSAIFVAALLTPAKSHAKAQEQSAVVNIAKVDFENQIPLAAEPADTGVNMPLWWTIVSVSAVMTGLVIYMDCRDVKKDAVVKNR